MTIQALTQTVQFNCDLSDREFAADYSICIYLIRMREYYRWAHDIAPDVPLDQPDLMEWVSDVEERWEDTQDQEIKALEFEGESFSAFDVEKVNTKLHPLGYTYSAGIGRFNKPVFMLAELESIDEKQCYSLAIAGKELARELTAPPATLQNGNILIRNQAVSRLIWDMYEEWQWHKPNNAMAKVVQFYNFEKEPIAALEQASLDQQEVLILHELGELKAQNIVASNWNDIVINASKQQQLFARAVRDFIADCVSTLPQLLNTRNEPCLHFYFASLTPMRKSMFPKLVLAYQQWLDSDSIDSLQSAVKFGLDHWSSVAECVTHGFKNKELQSDVSLNDYIEQHIL